MSHRKLNDLSDDEQLRIRHTEPIADLAKRLSRIEGDLQTHEDLDASVLSILTENGEIQGCGIIVANADGQTASLPTFGFLRPKIARRELRDLVNRVRVAQRQWLPVRTLYDISIDTERMVLLYQIPDRSGRILVVLMGPDAWSSTVEELTKRCAELLATRVDSEESAALVSADWWIRLLFEVVLDDRRHMSLLEAPTEADLKQLAKGEQSKGLPAARLLSRRKRLSKRFGHLPASSLWVAWMRTVHGELLERVGRELLEETAGAVVDAS